MLSTFFGLETAVAGLRANQAAVEVTAHNVDNANTPGYSRQVAQMETTPEMSLPGAGPINVQVGTGVQIQQIARIRSEFLDSQYQEQNSQLGQATVMQDTMNKVTAIINEPSTTGLSATMQNFWNAWSKVGSNPGDLSSAEELQQSAQSVTATLNQMGTQYKQLQGDLNTQLTANMTQANSYLQQIAQLNQQIANIQYTGGEPNDLLDKRGQLLDKLSNIVDIKTSTDAKGTLSVTIGSNASPAITGSSLLQEFQVNGQTLPTGVTALDPLTVQNGAIKGIENSQTKVLNYLGDLNTFANQLAKGSMQVKLAGAWQFPIPQGSTDQTATFPVSGTLPDGTPFGSPNDPSSTASPLVSNYLTAPPGKPDDQVTIDDSVTPHMVTVPAGTVVNVSGLNGLLHLGYSQNGMINPAAMGQSGTPQPDFFVVSPSSGETSISATSISVGVSAGQIGYSLRPTVTQDASGNKTWTSSNPGLSGDGTLAISVNNLQNTSMTFTSNNAAANVQGTLSEFWQGEVGQLGIDSQQANNQVTNQTSLVQQVDQQRQSLSGVSIDEEMANMVKYQQAYSASAKMISTINDMFTALLQQVQ